VFILVPSVLGGSESVEGEAVWVGSGRVEPKEHRRREDRGAFVVGVWGRGITLPSWLKNLGSVVSSPVVSATKSRPKTNLVHSRAVRKPLVAVIFSILKCIFYTRLIKILHNQQHDSTEGSMFSWAVGNRPWVSCCEVLIIIYTVCQHAVTCRAMYFQQKKLIENRRGSRNMDKGAQGWCLGPAVAEMQF